MNGTHKAGIAEALRHAQGVIHRDIQTGMLIAAGERQDRAKATELQASEDAEAWHPDHESEEHDGGGHRRRRQPEPESGQPGALIDLEA